MKPLITLSLLLITGTAFAQQNSPRFDSLGTVDNMPVVKGRGNSAHMPTQKNRGDAADMPTVGVPAPITSGPLSATGTETGNKSKQQTSHLQSDSLDQMKSSRKQRSLKKRQD